MIIETHNALRLGDNLVHMNFMRRVVASSDVEFIHNYGDMCAVEELIPFTEGVEGRIKLRHISNKTDRSVEAWRGPYWYPHPKRLDFAEFHIDWFNHLANQLGIQSPIHSRYDLLIDYPGLRTILTPTVDVVVINSQPLSGQFNSYNEAAYRALILCLLEAGYSVLTTKPTELCPSAAGHSVAWIGAVAAKAKVIVGTSTGPSWACLNVENRDALHVLCLDTENVILTDRGRVARTVKQASDILKEEGIL